MNTKPKMYLILTFESSLKIEVFLYCLMNFLSPQFFFQGMNAPNPDPDPSAQADLLPQGTNFP